MKTYIIHSIYIDGDRLFVWGIIIWWLQPHWYMKHFKKQLQQTVQLTVLIIWEVKILIQMVKVFSCIHSEHRPWNCEVYGVVFFFIKYCRLLILWLTSAVYIEDFWNPKWICVQKTRHVFTEHGHTYSFVTRNISQYFLHKTTYFPKQIVESSLPGRILSTRYHCPIEAELSQV